MIDLRCRFCLTPLQRVFADLGMSPLSNAFVRPEKAQEMEPFFPLTAYVCESCWLVQLPAMQAPEAIFSDYAYFSSYSDTWVAHARAYCEAMASRLGLGPASQVIEIASNDGYLLQWFRQMGIPVLGIEPAANVAKVAEERGVPTRVAFFTSELARRLAAEGMQADLLLGNNVLAHVPELRDFVAGLAITLKPAGTITMEFPHLLQLVARNQFDTIYHEHFSYFSLAAAVKVFEHHGLRIVDVDELPTHGGSIRIYARHAAANVPVSERVTSLLDVEREMGFDRAATYDQFAARVERTKRKLLQFLLQAKESGKRVAAYGAAAKGNTLLNYCGIRRDFLEYVVDRSPHKQGLLLPGTRIPILGPDNVRETRPDYLLILPWNLREEIVDQMGYIREWGGRFVVPIPEVEVID